MPHAIWKGNITFGLVNIPVGLYSAEKRDELDFNLLDKSDLSPVGYRKINKITGKEVKQPDIVKGYEYEDGRYVVLTEDDFKRANVKATQTVEIVDFVDAENIHPVYFDRPYYLAPLKRGEKGYVLLRETLKRMGKAAVAKVVIHSREYLAVVIPYGNVLELNLLRYAYEVKSPADLEIPEDDLGKTGVSEKELSMAQRLVEDMMSDWEPEKYKDTYREDLLSYIRKKVEAGETAEVAEAPPPAREAVPRGEVIDLMALLKKSVEEKEAAEKKEAARPRARKAAGK